MTGIWVIFYPAFSIIFNPELTSWQGVYILSVFTGRLSMTSASGLKSNNYKPMKYCS